MVAGRPVALYGKPERERGALVLMNPTMETREGIAPVYKAVSQVPAKVFAGLIAQAVRRLDGSWPEDLPTAVREARALPGKNEAVREAHLPTDWPSLKAARRRLAFEELFFYQIALALLRADVRRGVSIPVDGAQADAFWTHLPFSPTRAQMRVLREIACDLAGKHAMARLVQGDVGCGKTAVAFGAMWLAVDRGWQCAMMAPTEILARQHYESAQALLAPLGIRCGLLLGSMGQKAHREAHAAMREGAWQIAFGTHALLSPGVEFARLGLVVVDEQHRFGVRQRSQLAEKGDAPNVLVMSATPIPRTLSLILYGDLDVSVIDELPPGRKPVSTRIVPESKRADMYGFCAGKRRRGRQIYGVYGEMEYCVPLIEESEAVDAKPAEEIYEFLRTQALSDLRVELVHGRMRPADKDAVIAAFARGEVDVLVSTTVIEVGVNVPNASVMVIENAERFGLAQLHQLRGRVGRGGGQAWCFLMAEPNERLRTLTQTNDGFLVAQKDMELRGPGEILGTRQSGAIFEGAEIDLALLAEAHDDARAVLRQADGEEAAAAVRVARERFRDRLAEAGLN